MSTFIDDEVMKAHRASWFVYTGEIVDGVRQRIPRVATMRGFWPGYDVVCSCGEFETKTGGGVRRYVEQLLWEHRFHAQTEKDREEGKI